MNVRLREAVLDDAAALAALSTELGYPSTAEETTLRLARVLDSRDNRVMVAEDSSGAAVGWIHVFVAPRVESTPFAEIGGLVVTERARGRGIGEALVRAAEVWAREEGFGEIRVRSNMVRERAHRFYERLGYRRSKAQAVFTKETVRRT